MPQPTGRPPANLIGQRFGRLVAVERLPVVKGVRAKWRMQCDCGDSTVCDISHLRKGHTTSCGCFQREGLSKRRRKHGHSEPCTAEYAIWHHMKQRCTNPKNPAYMHYGGRGIGIHERWLDFENFLADVGLRPHPNLTFERKDNDGPYGPCNWKWATYAEQLNNRRPSQPRKRIVPSHIIY